MSNSAVASALTLFGIVNVTEDSFSDGGRFLDPKAALAHARTLVEAGAHVIDLGAAASNVDAKPVAADEEIRRLDPVIAGLQHDGTPVSVDSFLPDVQRFAIGRGVDYLNDIQGFPDPSLYPELAAARCKLVVMHAVQGRGRAQRLELSAAEVWDRIVAFFTERIAALEQAGIARERIIIDPGMGFFLSSRPEASLHVLARLRRAEARLRTAGAGFGVAQILLAVDHRARFRRRGWRRDLGSRAFRRRAGCRLYPHPRPGRSRRCASGYIGAARSQRRRLTSPRAG